MEETKVRVLPADVYDALELSVIAAGGIGGGCVSQFEGFEEPRVPMCVIGHAAYILGHEPHNTPDCKTALIGTEVGQALESAFGSLTDAVDENDAQVRRRVSWQTWCAKLNVVRGDQ